ncbi:Uncharacterised protein [Clostridium putrefaciens]|uniref:Rubrerythrin n=1 Tax=Clostridium putrefaciens TaxID=99675 RepID=A0A381J7H9_9CLOT|nr:hypothetical protein [Clostridium putrefaciens]SUY46933.1 Uncharacterised protein [Clostridium putrefaciens]
MYTVVDIIDNLSEIEKMYINFFHEVSDSDSKISSFKLVANALGKTKQNHMNFYYNLRNKMKGEEFIEVDMHDYDKISKSISEFKYSFKFSFKFKCNIDVIELIKISLSIEKDNIALLLIIRGILVKDKNYKYKKIYECLSYIIEDKNKYILQLEKLTV